MPVTIDRFKKIFTGRVSQDLLEARRAKCDQALRELRDAVGALESLGEDLGTFRMDLLRLVTQLNNVLAGPGTVREKYDALGEIKDEARERASACRQAVLDAPLAQQPAGRVLAALRATDASPARLLTMCREGLEEDGNFLIDLLALPGGRKALDDIVTSQGDRIPRGRDRELVKQALQARFDLTELGDQGLDRKTLPRLYRAMRLVPDAHVADNDQIDRLVFLDAPGASDWSGARITLRLQDVDTEQVLAPDDEDGVPEDLRPHAAPVNYFDHTTLHEIGHGVDAARTWMERKGHEEEFGGWEEVTVEQIADAVDAEMGFSGAFGAYPARLLKLVLADTLRRAHRPDMWGNEHEIATKLRDYDVEGDPALAYLDEHIARNNQDGWEETEPPAGLLYVFARPKLGTRDEHLMAFLDVVMNRMIDERKLSTEILEAALAPYEDCPPAPDGEAWEEIAAHPAVGWCTAVAQGDQWRRGNAGARQALLGDKVYNYDVSGWTRYSFAARSHAVTRYQFKTRHEWFAELYAAYYTDRLPEAHPAYAWLRDEIHTEP